MAYGSWQNSIPSGVRAFWLMNFCAANTRARLPWGLPLATATTRPASSAAALQERVSVAGKGQEPIFDKGGGSANRGAMPRQLRIGYPGAFYHVTARGDRREDIARDNADRAMWPAMLAEACRKTGWQD